MKGLSVWAAEHALREGRKLTPVAGSRLNHYYLKDGIIWSKLPGEAPIKWYSIIEFTNRFGIGDFFTHVQ